jgi:GntR family transcriptional repressor for pyruvate dehydrogenase complex
MDQIVQYLLSGDLKPGDKLPTEHEFAQQLGVGRNSIREAIKMLSSIGVIEIKRGAGTFIAESMSSSILNPLILSLVFEQGVSGELLELRLLLDTGVAELIIEKASDQDITRLEEANQMFHEETLKEHHDNPHVLRDFDLNFHRLFYELAGNTLLDKIAQAIYTLFFASIEETVEADPMTAYENHQKVIEAMKQRDVELLRQRMRESLSNYLSHDIIEDIRHYAELRNIIIPENEKKQ